MRNRFSRKFIAALIALMTSIAVLTGANAANANSTEIHVIFQPIATNNQMFWILTDAPTGTPLQVYVNGRHKDTVALRTHSTGEDYINYKKSWGLGTFQLRDGTTASKPLPMRAAIKMDKWEFRRVGAGAKKLRVKITAQRFNPGKNKWVKAPRTVLQAKKGKWKNVRKMKLNKKGKGQVTLNVKKAYRYRFVVKKTKKNFREVQKSFGKI